MTRFVPAVASMLFVLGCTSTPAVVPDGGLAPGVTRSPDGAGYCCPFETPSCDCTLLGGFTATGECAPFGVCDALPSEFRLVTDEHGCRRYTVGLGSCLARDAGSD